MELSDVGALHAWPIGLQDALGWSKRQLTFD